MHSLSNRTTIVEAKVVKYTFDSIGRKFILRKLNWLIIDHGSAVPPKGSEHGKSPPVFSQRADTADCGQLGSLRTVRSLDANRKLLKGRKNEAAAGRMKTERLRFFRSPWFKVFMDVDAEFLIRKLDEEAGR